MRPSRKHLVEHRLNVEIGRTKMLKASSILGNVIPKTAAQKRFVATAHPMPTCRHVIPALVSIPECWDDLPHDVTVETLPPSK